MRYKRVDKKIIGEIYTSTEPMDNLKVLCDGVAFHDFPSLEEFARRWAGEMVAEMPTTQQVSSHSDHWPFFLKSVPSAGGSDPTVVRTGGGCGHTRYDTLDKVAMQCLHLAAAIWLRRRSGRMSEPWVS